MRRSQGRNFYQIFFKFLDMKVEVRPVLAIWNQQNRLIILEVMANRVFEKQNKMAAKNKIFDFVLQRASKVSISTNSDP